MRKAYSTTSRLLAIALMFLFGSASAVFAAYSIPAEVISGGGSTSSGASHVLTGTIGQSSPPNVSSGVNYINHGGFIYQLSAYSISDP